MTHRRYCAARAFRRRSVWPNVPTLRRYHRLVDDPKPEHKWSEHA